MQPKTVESSYLEFINRVAADFEFNLQISRLGDHVTKDTWLCGAAYFWNRLKRLLLAETDTERNAFAYGIREEIENPGKSQGFQEFYSTCFPDLPEFYLAMTWKFSGRAVRDIGTPILALRPSKQRAKLIKALDMELDQLRALWMAPIGEPGSN